MSATVPAKTMPSVVGQGRRGKHRAPGPGKQGRVWRCPQSAFHRGAVSYTIRIAGDKQSQGFGNDREFDGQARERFAIDLSVNRIRLERLAHEGFSLPEMHVLFLTEIAHPQGRQIAEIAKAALRGQGHDFELLLEQVGLIGDFERAAIILRAPYDDKCDIKLPVAGFYAEARKRVAQNFACSLPPVGQNAYTRFQTKIDGINDHAIGAGTGDAEEVTFSFGLLERCRKSERNLANFAMNQPLGCARNIPGQIEFFGENVGGSAGKERKRNAVAVREIGQAVDHFIEGSITATGNDQLTTVTYRLLGDFHCVAGTSGFGEVDLHSGGRQNVTSLVEQAAPAVATIAGIRIVNQQSVLKLSFHISQAETFIVSEKIGSTAMAKDKSSADGLTMVNAGVHYQESALLWPRTDAELERRSSRGRRWARSVDPFGDFALRRTSDVCSPGGKCDREPRR